MPKGLKNVESEKTLERLLNKLVQQELKGWSIKFLSMFISGLPDRICLVPPGIIFFAEIKTTGKTPDPIQLVRHAQLRKLGFKVYVIDSTKQIHNIINEYK